MLENYNDLLSTKLYKFIGIVPEALQLGFNQGSLHPVNP